MGYLSFRGDCKIGRYFFSNRDMPLITPVRANSLFQPGNHHPYPCAGQPFRQGGTMKRFTQNELFELRNHIPIDVLIEDRLNMPAKISDGQFRFLCPLCGEFQTATNPATNLARCFRCGKNFNTIDMVMTCERTSFIETVHALKAYREKLKAARFNSSQEATK